MYLLIAFAPKDSAHTKCLCGHFVGSARIPDIKNKFGNAWGAQWARLGNHMGSPRQQQHGPLRMCGVRRFSGNAVNCLCIWVALHHLCNGYGQQSPCAYDIFAAIYINYSAHMDLLGTHLGASCDMQTGLY